MADSLNIEALLQQGYFKTSRSKSIQPTSPGTGHLTPPLSPSPPSRFRLDYDDDHYESDRALVPARRAPSQPLPPPLVEDEAESLAKEYRPSPSVSDDDVPSRGDFEQEILMLEVHEHNPERRFVMVPKDDSGAETTDTESTKRKKEPSKEHPPASTGRKYEPVFAEGDHLSAERPAAQRRKSRQDLPPLDTRTDADRSRRHSRAHSAVGARPDGYGRTAGRYDDDKLSPEYTKHGSSGRDRTYHGYGGGSSTNRRRESVSRRKSPSPAVGMRSESNVETRRPRRRSNTSDGYSRERSAGYTRENSFPIRSGTRESVLNLNRDDDATPVPPSTSKTREYRKRESSRSSDESVSSSRSMGRRRRTSTRIIQDPPVIRDTRGVPPPVPPHGKPVATTADGFPMGPRSSVTFPLAGAAAGAAAASHLPYPDDEPISSRSSAAGSAGAYMPNEPSASMPNFPPPIAEVVTPRAVPPTNGQASSYVVPSFDPVKDALPVDKEMGSYRRYSEGQSNGEFPGFPECQRKTPTAGEVDWLTIPHSDINICPDCYHGVFANSRFRTEFKPMLRQTDKPLACDFGSTPWYRIAWLLTRKNELNDLKLFHAVDNILNGSRNQPCPGSRSATRNWLTIKDPYKRRMVKNFTVCWQCAKTAEVLLPNMFGVFVPLDAREPVESVCALHYAPQRKRFALYFDLLETTSDRAMRLSTTPNISDMSAKLEKLSILEECREDSPVRHGYWYTMQMLPRFTVCEECFTEVVKPKIKDNDSLARNFYKEPERLKEAACQLYSARMREVFRKACRRNDAEYLREKVEERNRVEADIHAKLMKLDKMEKDGQADAWTCEEQIAKLIKEWKAWE